MIIKIFCFVFSLIHVSAQIVSDSLTMGNIKLKPLSNYSPAQQASQKHALTEGTP